MKIKSGGNAVFRTALMATAVLAALILSTVGASAGEPGCQPMITLDRPLANATVQGSNVLSGWAVDSAGATGSSSGVQDILVYRDGQAGAGGALLGQATAVARPDVDATLGLTGAKAGWTLNYDFSTVPAGPHTLYIYAITACGWAYTTSSVVVGSAASGTGAAPAPAVAGPEINVDSPSRGQTIAAGQVLQVGGWAAEAAGSGNGVDQVHIYADGQAGAGGTILGAATYGKARADVAAAKGKPEWTNSGFDFSWTVTGLTSGPHTLYVYAHSSATGQWTYKTVDITVTGGVAPAPAPSAAAPAPAGGPAPALAPTANGAVVKITAPGQGATATGTVYLRGLAADCTTGDPASSIRVYAGGPNGQLLGDATLQPSNNQLLSVCGNNAVGSPVSSGAYSWEYLIAGSDNPNTGPRTYAVVAAFARGTATDSVSINGNFRNGNGGPGFGGNNGFYNNGSCGAGYAFTNNQCIYDGGNSYCSQGYVSQNGTCAYAGNQNGYNGYNGYNGNCSAGMTFTNGQCIYSGGNSYCPAGYVYQNGNCQR